MNKSSDKILLVLDLDETLIFATKTKLNRDSDFNSSGYQIYVRPYFKDFLNYIQANFIFGIWSSASDDYVRGIANKLFENTAFPEFIWGRSNCKEKRLIEADESGYFNSEDYGKIVYQKPLKKLKRKGYDLKRILIIDDSPEKVLENYGNAIYVKEYTGDMNDVELKYLINYLEELREVEDVRKIEKRNWQIKKR